MKAAALILILFAAPAAEALHFANGLKIGEVTASSAVIWTRLTKEPEATRRIEKWDGEEPWVWSAPGAAGEVRVVVWEANHEGDGVEQDWVAATAENDFCHQFRIDSLKPATGYQFEVQARRGGEKDPKASITGRFTTAPAPGADAAVTFVSSTCQDFGRRDDWRNGHKIYKSMLALNPSFFVQTGDTLYYDKPGPLAQDIATARYKWNRFYALPYPRTFHRTVPSYWLHDDHDVLKNDCWPGQTYGEFTWDQGLKVWREQIPQSDKPYRTFRWGKHLQVWFPEGREYRSPNTMKDGPTKTIFGAEQWAWLEKTTAASDATFKLFVSATPVVGPDRKGKNDNHANEGFAHEGKRLRKFLSAIPGCFVINGDRHWQYHSIDPKTGLHEFGSGPASDKHAGGWKYSLQPEWQDFLRIKGGFLSVRVNGNEAVFKHHDVDGKVVHEMAMEAP